MCVVCFQSSSRPLPVSLLIVVVVVVSEAVVFVVSVAAVIYRVVEL